MGGASLPMGGSREVDRSGPLEGSDRARTEAIPHGSRRDQRPVLRRATCRGFPAGPGSRYPAGLNGARMDLLELLTRGDVDAFNNQRGDRARLDFFAADLPGLSLVGIDLSG